MSKTIRLCDIDASKRFLNAWTNGKVVCPHVECKQNKTLLESSSLPPHYRIMHPTSNANNELLISKGNEILRDFVTRNVGQSEPASHI